MSTNINFVIRRLLYFSFQLMWCFLISYTYLLSIFLEMKGECSVKDVLTIYLQFSPPKIHAASVTIITLKNVRIYLWLENYFLARFVPNQILALWLWKFLNLVSEVIFFWSTSRYFENFSSIHHQFCVFNDSTYVCFRHQSNYSLNLVDTSTVKKCFTACTYYT